LYSTNDKYNFSFEKVSISNSSSLFLTNQLSNINRL
jgi:hypothetical protein